MDNLIILFVLFFGLCWSGRKILGNAAALVFTVVLFVALFWGSSYFEVITIPMQMAGSLGLIMGWVAGFFE